MLLNVKKSKTTLLVSLLLSCFCPAAVVSVVVGGSLFSCSAVHAQDQSSDPVAAIEAPLENYLDNYDAGYGIGGSPAPDDGASSASPNKAPVKYRIYNHFVLSGSARGQKFTKDYWTPSNPGKTAIFLASNPVYITQTFNTIFGSVTVVLKGVVETWKAP